VQYVCSECSKHLCSVCLAGVFLMGGFWGGSILRCCIFVFNVLHLVDLVMIGLVLHLPKFMVYYGFSRGFIFSYLSTAQEIGWKERLRYDLYCVEWGIKPQLNQSNSIDTFLQYKRNILQWTSQSALDKWTSSLSTASAILAFCSIVH